MRVSGNDVALSTASVSQKKEMTRILSKTPSEDLDKKIAASGLGISNRYQGKKINFIEYIITRYFNNRFTFSDLASLEELIVTKRLLGVSSWKVFRLFPYHSSDNTFSPPTLLPSSIQVEEALYSYFKDSFPSFVRCNYISQSIFFIFICICSRTSEPEPLHFAPLTRISCFYLPKSRLLLTAVPHSSRAIVVDAITQAFSPGGYNVATKLSAFLIAKAALTSEGIYVIESKKIGPGRKRRRKNITNDIDKDNTSIHRFEDSEDEIDHFISNDESEDDEMIFVVDEDEENVNDIEKSYRNERQSIINKCYSNPKLALEIMNELSDDIEVFFRDEGPNPQQSELFKNLELKFDQKAEAEGRIDANNSLPYDQIHFSAESINERIRLSFSFFGTDVLGGLASMNVWSEPVLRAIVALPNHTDLQAQKIIQATTKDKKARVDIETFENSGIPLVLPNEVSGKPPI